MKVSELPGVHLVQASRKLSMLHRSRVDIIADILAESDAGAKKTHIMYKCNLSFRQLHAYIDLLIDTKLLRRIEKEGNNHQELYKITSKGKAFLQAYKSIKGLLTA